MSRCVLSIAQMLTAAILLCAANRVQAFADTAYVSICCNAPSTAGVFAASTLTRARTIQTGSGGDGIALSPDGKRMFVTVDNASELQVLSTDTGAILATVPVPLSISGEPPLEVAISPNGSRVYVLAPQARPDALLLAIDTRTYQVTQSANIANLASLGPLLVSPDGTQLYFEVGYAKEYIQVVDASSLALGNQIPVNEFPSDLAVTASGLILMTDSSNQLLVIDPRSSEVRVLPLPDGNHGTPGAVIASPDSTTAYISFATGSMMAVDIATGATLFDAPIDYSPTHLAISPDGTSLYSSNLSRIGAWSLSKFHIPTQTVVTTVRQLGPISAVALTRDGLSFYVLNANDSAIASVDMRSRTLTHVIEAGVGINSLAIPPGGTTVWASQYGFGLGGVTLFLNTDTERLKYLVRISGALAFSPSGSVVYVYGPGRLRAYDVNSLHAIGTVTVGELTNIAQAIPSPDGTRLYVSASFISGARRDGNVLFSPGEILVIDTSTYKRIAVISVSDGMGTMALTPDGSTLLYTANRGRVHLLSTATNKRTTTIQLEPTNGLLNGLALSPDGTTAYVTDDVNNLLLVANLATQTELSRIAVGAFPSPIVITPNGSEAWIATLEGLEIVDTASGRISAVALPGEPSDIAFGP